ncbi:MAG: phospholipid carrier-dependent glycosyltransferase [Candidatus Acidiferrales bacterium]
MLDSTDLSDESQNRRKQNVTALSAGAVAIFICLFGNLGAIGLVGPDEPRYAWIARAMAETGDWVTPRLYGQPWFEKPILYYWAAAVGFRSHLSPEVAARLPSAFAALAAAIAIGWLAWNHYGGENGFVRSSAFLAPLIFSTSVAAIGFARAATPDMLFGASIALAMACAATVLRRAGVFRSLEPPEHRARPPLALIFFGAWLGVAVLAKGPAAILLAGGAIVLWALATKNWRAGFRLLHPLAIAGFCVVALPWYVLCALRNAEFLHVFIIEHNFERYLTPVFMHRQPFWFFGPIVLLALLPWTALLCPAAQEGLSLWREKSWSDSPGFFFACWAVFPVLFFSFSQSKLPGYILPAIPPLALLLAVALERATRTGTGRAGLILSAVGVTWIAIGFTAIIWAYRMPVGMREDLGAAIFALSVIGAAGGILIVALALFRRRSPLTVSFFLVVIVVLFAGARLLPSLDPYVSAGPHAALMQHDLRPDRIFTYHLRRSWTYGLAFYMRRELPEWSPHDPEPALVLTSPAGLDELRRLGRFQGVLDETYRGILFVPVRPAPR